MNMEHGDYLKLQEQLQDHFDGRYVQLEDCEKTVEREEGKIDKLALEFAKTSTKLNIMIAILSAIAAPVVSVCVKLLFGS